MLEKNFKTFCWIQYTGITKNNKSIVIDFREEIRRRKCWVGHIL